MSEEQTEISGLDPRKPFYLAVAITNTDGSLEIWEVPTEWETLDEALISAKADLEEFGGEIFIYECYPVKRIIGTTTIAEEDVQSPSMTYKVNSVD